MSEFWQDPYIASVIIFAAIIGLYVYKDRKNFKRDFVVLMRRTQRAKKTIIKIGESHPRFWKWVGNIGVALGLYASVFVVITLLFNLVQVVTVGGQSGLALVLPTPTQDVAVAPGVLAVPFWYWIIAIAALVIVHEGMHGILSAAEKIKIKSLGWGLFLIIPLAFVEPDEKQLQKKKPMTQMRIFAGGSLANFMLAIVCVLIMTFAFSGAYASGGGLGFQSVINGSGAHQANLTGAIIEINGQKVSTLSDLNSTMSEISPGQEISIKTTNLELHPQAVFSGRVIDNMVESPVNILSINSYFDPSPIVVAGSKTSDFVVKTTLNPENNETAFIGISNIFEVDKYNDAVAPYSGFVSFFQGLFFFMFLINLGVGLANMLPIGPLDGGRLWGILLKRITHKRSKEIMSALSYLTLLLIIANFAAGFLSPLF